MMKPPEAVYFSGELSKRTVFSVTWHSVGYQVLLFDRCHITGNEKLYQKPGNNGEHVA